MRLRLLSSARAALLAGVLAAAGCDDSVEVGLCQETTAGICDTWFSCYRVFSEALWPGGEVQCRHDLQSWCARFQAFEDCEVDNDTLDLCLAGVSAAACDALPSQCQQVLTCYSDHQSKLSAGK